MGFMYSEEPVKICCTMILLAFSEGWNGSQNAYKSLFGHRFDKGVHSPIPLYGPCPQHAIFDVTNPAQIQYPLVTCMSLFCNKLTSLKFYYWYTRSYGLCNHYSLTLSKHIDRHVKLAQTVS